MLSTTLNVVKPRLCTFGSPHTPGGKSRSVAENGCLIESTELYLRNLDPLCGGLAHCGSVVLILSLAICYNALAVDESTPSVYNATARLAG